MMAEPTQETPRPKPYNTIPKGGVDFAPPGARWLGWKRRLIAVPLFIIIGLILLVSAPLWLIGLGIFDIVGKRNWAGVRALTSITSYFVLEIGAIIGLTLIFPIGLVPPWRALFQRLNVGVQAWWGRNFLETVIWAYNARFIVEGEELLMDGPVLLFARHTSTIDAMLPAFYTTIPFGIMMGYVMKDGLLWDACLNISMQRLPNVFIQRGPGSAERETDRIRNLACNLHPNQVITIFPEGTRYTPKKRQKILKKLKKRGEDKAVTRVESYRNVLPPRYGGALALLDATPANDVVFFGHTGLENSRTIKNFWAGHLINRDVKLHFWRVASEDIPVDEEGRKKWLDEQWLMLDQWVEDNRDRKTHDRDRRAM